jgi:hypothetical protein
MSNGEDHKTKRVRSPAYPSMNLKTAIERAETIYKHEKRNAAPVSVVATHCGTNIESSAGLRLISALKQFGLVVEEGSGDDRQVRLSGRALDILLAESEDSDARIAAIKDAALSPKIHATIWNNYGGKLPSDATLRIYLIRQLEFNDGMVGRFIKDFRSTISFAKLVQGDTIDEGNSGDDEESQNQDRGRAMSAVVQQDQSLLKQTVREFPIPLLSGGIAVVKLPFPMSKDDFKHFTATLTAWEPALTREATSRRQPAQHEDDEDGADDDEDVEVKPRKRESLNLES